MAVPWPAGEEAQGASSLGAGGGWLQERPSIPYPRPQTESEASLPSVYLGTESPAGSAGLGVLLGCRSPAARGGALLALVFSAPGAPLQGQSSRVGAAGVLWTAPGGQAKGARLVREEWSSAGPLWVGELPTCGVAGLTPGP